MFLLFPLKGDSYDLGAFESWIGVATQRLSTFYSVYNWCDYPPFSICIFWGFGNMAKLVGLFNMANIAFLVKFIPALFDLATSALIYFFLRQRLSFKLSLAATAFYAFNPAIIYNVAVWGQYDALYTFFLVLALILALKNKPELSAVVFALAVLTKPQAIALAPLMVFLIYKKGGLKRLFYSSLGFIAAFFMVILPFEWSNPVTFLSGIYLVGYDNYKFTSVNAFNIWGLLGFLRPDGDLFIVGWILFGLLAAAVLYILSRRLDSADESFTVFCAFMLLFGFFMLQTRMHERYLFPAIGMLALAVPFIKKARPIYVVLTGTLLFNQAYVLYLQNSNLPIPTISWVSILGIAVNVSALVYALALMVSYNRKEPDSSGSHG